MQCTFCTTTTNTVTCTTCNQHFCNNKNKSKSHIIYHLIKAKHSSIKVEDVEINCTFCGESNLLLLGFCEDVLICQNCKQLKRRDDEWTQAVCEKVVDSRIVGSSFTDFDENFLNKLTEDTKFLESTKTIFEKNEYERIFCELVTAEMEEERSLRELQIVESDVVLQKMEYEEEMVLTAQFINKSSSELRINIGDEMRFEKGEMIFHGIVMKTGELIAARITDKYVKEINMPEKSVLVEGMIISFIWKGICYKRMLNAIKKINTNVKIYKLLLNFVDEKNEGKKERRNSNIKKSKLNTSQKLAVAAALNNTITLVQGPPGTGKTVTSAEIVNSLVEKGYKVLVVAPSNTAVDQITLAIYKTGVKIVRVHGLNRELVNMDYISGIAKLSLEHIVKKKDEMDGMKTKNKKDSADVKIKFQKRKQHKFSKNTIGKEAEIINPEANYNLRVGEKSDRFSVNISNIDNTFDNFSIDNSSVKSNYLNEIPKKELRREIIDRADVIACTCVTAGSSLLHGFKFDAVLIDEACQATEPQCLIPLLYGCTRLILVGDHRQLGPTIMNRRAAIAGLKKSLFERCLEMGIIPHLLNTQYRMHPLLIEYSNKRFYDSKIKSGVDAENRKSFMLPSIFLCSYGKEELSISGTSFLNRNEAAEVKNIVDHFRCNGVKNKQIGVITFYEGQRAMLNMLINNEGEENEIEIMNVDGFQGREKDYIILSLVRSNETQGVGFLKNEQRVNVALTRARHGLVIVGNPNTLLRDDIWHDILCFYDSNGWVFDGPINNMTRVKINKQLFDFKELLTTLNIN